ncbi:FRG domain-containing protein [Shewanella algae]|uniref:FRG domain protein n=1 Tax=Shewanella algae TaxID=38313 RepID=A0AAD1K7V4_9GAMM|nr:FRG domain-containing protein [Shewanella algae]MBO2594585.1 FRG domain-containing protein [Shewanella algae]MBO2665941.1 FRG domain-containing protein [Shewanella algae]BCV44364.1 FRG domain protein [Shewanella algae]
MSAEDFWKPFEGEISDFNGLLTVINQVMEKAVEKNIKFAWRGQIDASWALHSSLYRRMNLTKSKVLTEDEIAKEEHDILAELHCWGLHSSSQTGRLSILNQLAMLQHYGAPTRLIDITFNAWVGAWFAVEEKWSNGEQINEDKDARLFAFDVTDRLINENESYRCWEDDLSRPWKTDKVGGLDKKEWTTSVFAWKPANLDARIAAQNGGFLFGGIPASVKPDNKRFQFPKSPNNDGWWSIEEGRKACCVAARPHVFEPTKGKGAGSGALYTFRIKASAKQDISRRLDRLFGYRHSTIYPDFSGFSNFAMPRIKSY